MEKLTNKFYLVNTFISHYASQHLHILAHQASFSQIIIIYNQT